MFNKFFSFSEQHITKLGKNTNLFKSYGEYKKDIKVVTTYKNLCSTNVFPFQRA